MNTDTFTFECPTCGQHISATSADSGIEASCPACSNTFTVPEKLVETPAQTPKSKSRKMRVPLRIAGVILLLGLIIVSVWFPVHLRQESAAKRVWKERYDKVATGMTRDEVYTILGYEKRAIANGVNYAPIPERVLPAVAASETMFFTDNSYLIILTSKFGHKLEVLYSRNEIVEQKSQKKLE